MSHTSKAAAKSGVIRSGGAFNKRQNLACSVSAGLAAAPLVRFCVFQDGAAGDGAGAGAGAALGAAAVRPFHPGVAVEAAGAFTGAGAALGAAAAGALPPPPLHWAMNFRAQSLSGNAVESGMSESNT